MQVLTPHSLMAGVLSGERGYAMRLYASGTVFFAVLVGILLLCTNPERDNPFDPKGTKFHRATISTNSSLTCRENQPLSLKVNAVVSNGAIALYYWGVDPAAWIDSSTSPTLTIPYPFGGGLRRIIVGVRDDAGVVTKDSVSVLFNRRPTSAGMNAPASGATAVWSAYDYSAGAGTVSCDVFSTDPDGARDSVSYSLSVTDGAATVTATGKSPLTVSGLKPLATWQWTLVARDLLGDTCSVAGTFKSPVVPPAPSLVVSPSSLVFGSVSTSTTFTVSNSGSGPLSWTASDNAAWLTLSPVSGTLDGSAATVTATVNRTGVATGAYSGTISVSSNGGSSTIGVTMQVVATITTIRIVNQLVDSVSAWANGFTLGKVPSRDSVSFTRSGLDTLRVGYDLIKRTTTSGVGVGEDMSGVWNTISKPGALHRFEVGNILGTTTYFTPFITNTSTSDLAPIVNQANIYSLSCDCTVPMGLSNAAFGYYTFVSTTDVRVYEPGMGFTGLYMYWRNGQIDSLMQTGSGRVDLNCTAVSW
jgi:hypothetical protein